MLVEVKYRCDCNIDIKKLSTDDIRISNILKNNLESCLICQQCKKQIEIISLIDERKFKLNKLKKL